MSEPRTIKKYPNRRLYDTVESRYITLADIRRLVIDRIDFVVMDKKSQEDITRSILLQVIAEQEHGGEPLMSRDFLSQISNERVERVSDKLKEGDVVRVKVLEVDRQGRIRLSMRDVDAA